MTLFDHPEFNNHQQVHFFEDKATGLRAIIAIHYLVNGSAGGGCRFYPYATTEDALTDVLRLSRAMTYKFVLTGIPFGGAKSVIIGNPKTDKTEALLESFGKKVDSLKGQYRTAGDVGTNEEDMLIIKRQTNYVAGVKGKGGDTARLTGYGVYQSIKAAVKHKMGQDTLKGIRIAIQGVGGVGVHLIPHLLKEGAEIMVADIDKYALGKAKEMQVHQIIDSDQILFQEVDVLAPCALGGILNADTIPKIKAPIIVGGANNQLSHDSMADRLLKRDILFIPDFVANSGGVIQGAGGLNGLNEETMIAQVNGIFDTTLKLLHLSEAQNITPLMTAYQWGETLIQNKSSGI